jgi:hypothetical protein
MTNKNTILYCFSLLLLQLLASTIAQDTTASAGGITVDYVGRSGQFKIVDDEDDGKFVRVDLRSLEETGSNNRVSSFASQDYEWIGPDILTINGTNITRVEYDSTLRVSPGNGRTAEFNFVTEISEEPFTVEYGNETIEVAPGTLKFSFSLEGWPFESEDSRVVLALRLQSPNGGLDNTTEEDDEMMNNVVADSFYLDAPSFAICNDDGVETQEDVGITYTRNGNNLIIEYDLPNCPSIFYDPTIMVRDDFQPAGLGGAAVAFIVIGSVVGVLAIVGGVFYSRQSN